MNMPDTIVAPATPSGVGGLAVVRISGPKTRGILVSLDKIHREPEARLAQFVHLVDDSDVEFDDGIAIYFPSPNSYTGEDVAEISCHGNPLIVQHLVAVCRQLGARIAEPGEFTQRAFLNGKLDLIQAEAVASFIEAQSTESAQLNHRLLRGELSQRLDSMKSDLMSLLQSVEFILDISEEDADNAFIHKLELDTKRLAQSAEQMISTYSRGRLLTEGATVVLYGPPNSGKSTLLNRLSNSDRAITSAEPGTTRDYLDVRINLDGIPVTLIDTAGLRESNSAIEADGIRRTRELMNNADVLVRIQSADEINEETADSGREKPHLEVMNKSDLLPPKILAERKTDFPDRHLISALNGDGVSTLLNAIKKVLGGSAMTSDEMALTTARQYDALVAFRTPLVQALEILNSHNPSLELVSFEFRESLQALDQLLGKTTPDDIINGIFSSFCVGK